MRGHFLFPPGSSVTIHDARVLATRPPSSPAVSSDGSFALQACNLFASPAPRPPRVHSRFPQPSCADPSCSFARSSACHGLPSNELCFAPSSRKFGYEITVLVDTRASLPILWKTREAKLRELDAGETSSEYHGFALLDEPSKTYQRIEI